MILVWARSCSAWNVCKKIPFSMWNLYSLFWFERMSALPHLIMRCIFCGLSSFFSFSDRLTSLMPAVASNQHPSFRPKYTNNNFEPIIPSPKKFHRSKTRDILAGRRSIIKRGVRKEPRNRSAAAPFSFSSSSSCRLAFITFRSDILADWKWIDKLLYREWQNIGNWHQSVPNHFNNWHFDSSATSGKRNCIFSIFLI